MSGALQAEYILSPDHWRANFVTGVSLDAKFQRKEQFFPCATNLYVQREHHYSISLSVIIPLVLQQSEPEQLTTGGHLEIISVELIEWQDSGFRGIVVDTGNSDIFPVGAKLTVVFREYNTEIVLDDGTSYGYGDIQTDDINWEIGSVVEVSFGVYEKYDADKEYENKVYAYRVELVPD